jgi:voltage-gated potassium channel
MSSIKKNIAGLLQKGANGSRWYLAFDYFIVVLILLNVLAVFVESFPQSMQYSTFLRKFELFSVIIFTIEYAMRLYVADLTHPKKTKYLSYLAFIFSPLALIDLVSILPFYLPLVFAVDLRFLRIFRFFRFLRIMKFKRYIEPLDLIASVIKEKSKELLVTLIIALIIIVSASAMIYFLENPAQPEVFTDMLSSVWWTVDSMTPVSFEKKVPLTFAGRLLGGSLGLFGVGLVALPAGIISAGFLQKINEKKKNGEKETSDRCPHCGK